MARTLLDLPEEMLLLIGRELFVYEALFLTSTCRRLRHLGMHCKSLWTGVLRTVPVPLPPGLTMSNATGAQLHQAALAAATMHVRWSRSARVQFRKQVRLMSTTAGDASTLVLLHLIRGGRWAVTCTSSGRVVIWDLSENAPRARHQIVCTPFSLDDRTIMLDEDADGRGAVFAVSLAVAGKRFLRVLRLRFPTDADARPEIEEAGSKEMSNARISFALAVSGAGSRVAVARMDAVTHRIDVFVWDYAEDLDLRLHTTLVYLIDISACQLRITADMLLFYGTSAANSLLVSLVSLAPGVSQDIRDRKEDRYVHCAYQAAYALDGAPSRGRMPVALTHDQLALVFAARHGANFTHHLFHVAPSVPVKAEDGAAPPDSPIQPVPFALARSAAVGLPDAPPSSKASPILGAGGKRALWVSGSRLFGASLCTAEAPRELELPADVARAVGGAERIAYDEAWSVVALASDAGQIWALYY
ncbi:hypothetical protein AURDEDRAFT_188123 [Auricularia subglabra TFB-10046 SS5]|nr:hypothetical protein AURDEDRAFT_188123 [Auricularia subglabra TFB-10046 SS5]